MVPTTDIHDDRLPNYVRLTDVVLREKLEAENDLYMTKSLKVIQQVITINHRPYLVLADEQWLTDLIPSSTRAGGDDKRGNILVYVYNEEKLQETARFHFRHGAIATMNRLALTDP